MPKAKPASLDEPTNLAKAMGRRVKEAREQAGMSQAELAAQIHRRQASLSDIENVRLLTAKEKDFEHAQSKIDGVLQSRRGDFLPDPLVLLETEYAKPIESCVLQRQPVFGCIHAEPARPTGPRREVQVTIDNFGPGDAFGFQIPEILDEVP